MRKKIVINIINGFEFFLLFQYISNINMTMETNNFIKVNIKVIKMKNSNLIKTKIVLMSLMT